MSKAGYLPRADKDRVVWFNNVQSKFATYAIGLGFTYAEYVLVAGGSFASLRIIFRSL